MQVQSFEKPYDDINITPMLDLAYVLLVIFIIMTTASIQGAKVDLPSGSAAQNLAQPRTRVIAVSPQGQLFLDAVPVSQAELEQRLRNAKAVTPDVPVVLKGDRAVQYDKVISVLDLCGRLGITSVGLAWQRAAS